MDLQAPRGMHDIYFEQARSFGHIYSTACEVAIRFGFGEIATPILESTDVFKRTLGDSSDIVNKEMYSFDDRGGDSMTLRPEGTAGVVRAVISEGLKNQMPLKFYYCGPMFRYERPQKGRTRQFHQIGIELIGIDSLQADLEALSFATLFLDELGVLKKTKLQINSIGQSEERIEYRNKLVEFLTPYKEDLSKDSKTRLLLNPLRILDSKDEKDQSILKDAPKLFECFSGETKQKYDNLKNDLNNLGIQFEENPQLVRGLDYYSDLVYEFIGEGLGAQSTVLAGGRYDALFELMGGTKTPAVGWASGLERLSLMLEKVPTAPSPTTLIPMGEKAQTFCLNLAHKLRSKALHIDMSYGGNLSKRMKKAAKAGAKFTIVIGEDEIKNARVEIKNLESGDITESSFDQLDSVLWSL